MSEDTEELFIKQVTTFGLVWALKNKGGFANTTSAGNEEVTVIPFWADKALAKACARDDWKGYLPVAIPLAEFLETWCFEMFENDMLAGLNWNANMEGAEVTAASLALALLKGVKANNAAIALSNYDNLDQFIEELSGMIGGDE